MESSDQVICDHKDVENHWVYWLEQGYSKWLMKPYEGSKAFGC